MTRYFIFLSYRGTAYHGWQMQPGRQTVQGVLTKVLSTVLASQLPVTGAGRTDTGVHASFFCAHFDSIRDMLDTDEQFIYNLNSLLPADIAVKRITKVKADASARFDALSRSYTYTIIREKDPFSADTAWLLYWHLDVDRMNEAAAILMNHNDFTSFSRLHGSNKTNFCRVTAARWTEEKGRLVFNITADRFLRNMVRAIVGTLIPVGRGKLSVADFEGVIDGKNRGLAGQSAPAHGLSLTGIEYPPEIFI
ncbi:MAG: tRNA pseudouridine(38-40) synthase TruA [Bacteroidales bacterium]|nr:tRNA pseudouridine(38-40) synthase TruA [Bacteroidales bacterium]MCB9028775.1 tRNA pseudouridine(38-40) synthase TruA [Bacteroidales bacterium]